MGLVLINGVVDASTNFIDSTPSGATANVGDRIFKTKKGELLEFDDISISTSQSYAFDGNSGIKVDESKLNDFDSDTRFSQQFWVYRTDPTINTNTPLLSYTLDNLDSNVLSLIKKYFKKIFVLNTEIKNKLSRQINIPIEIIM